MDEAYFTPSPTMPLLYRTWAYIMFLVSINHNTVFDHMPYSGLKSAPSK